MYHCAQVYVIINEATKMSNGKLGFKELMGSQAFTRFFLIQQVKVQRGNIDLDATDATNVQYYMIFIATWNVGGRSSPSYLNFNDWLHSSLGANIYVLGYVMLITCFSLKFL